MWKRKPWFGRGIWRRLLAQGKMVYVIITDTTSFIRSGVPHHFFRLAIVCQLHVEHYHHFHKSNFCCISQTNDVKADNWGRAYFIAWPIFANFFILHFSFFNSNGSDNWQLSGWTEENCAIAKDHFDQINFSQSFLMFNKALILFGHFFIGKAQFVCCNEKVPVLRQA